MHLNFERELNFRIRGVDTKGKLKILRVEQIAGKNRWACYWSLAHIHPEEGRVFGDDSLDSLFTCLDFIGNLIRGSEKDGLEVWWQYEGDHCGLSFSEYPDSPETQ